MNFETLDYQVAVALNNRPCGSVHCLDQFPALPSRWCPQCLLAAVVQKHATDIAYVRVQATEIAYAEMRRRWDEIFSVSGQGR